MYQGQQGSAQIGEGNTGQFNIACLNRVDRMCNRREDGDVDRYFIAFRYALFYVMAAIPKDKRNLILQDFATLERKLEQIQSDATINEQTKTETIRAMKLEFAESHEYHIFEAFSKVGIYHISDDGVLDFEKHDIEQLRSVARADTNKIKVIEREAKAETPGQGEVVQGQHLD